MTPRVAKNERDKILTLAIEIVKMEGTIKAKEKELRQKRTRLWQECPHDFKRVTTMDGRKIRKCVFCDRRRKKRISPLK